MPVYAVILLLPAVNNKIKVPPGAEELVGRAVEHLFEKEDGEKNEWRGMVLSRAPIMTHWYYITYEKDPVLYMYQLWDDYKDGDLRVLPESGTLMRLNDQNNCQCFMLSDADGNVEGRVHSITKQCNVSFVFCFFSRVLWQFYLIFKLYSEN